MAETIDARGLSCPAPVIKTKKALDNLTEGEVVVFLDEEVAKENITRLVGSFGYTFEVVEEAGEFTITINKRRKEE